MINDIISNLILIDKIHPIHLTGGLVRDIILKKKSNDIDITIPENSLEIAKRFADNIKASFVPLDKEEGVARVVTNSGITVDFSNFRSNARNISEDLSHRDFTINAMAIALSDSLMVLEDILKGVVLEEFPRDKIIDPFSGINDIKKGLIRAIKGENLIKDPIRLLRAFRFLSEFGFVIHDETLKIINENSQLIKYSAPERVNSEIEKIILTQQSGNTLKIMAENSILFHIIPELAQMKGVSQPLFHHLDVLEHSFLTLVMVDDLCVNPQKRFDYAFEMKNWLEDKSHIISLKLAALLHDIGKPMCRKISSVEKITFYRHDIQGSKICNFIGNRLRFPTKITNLLQSLVRFHMRPFHLVNTINSGGPSKRALRRLLKEISDDYPGLFLLAMADEMAGCGPLKPPDLHQKVNHVWKTTHEFYIENLDILKRKKRLLDGSDIQNILSVSPGPIIGKALNILEEAHIMGIVSNREEAKDFIIKWYERISVPHN